ncbi:MAG: hypothetical protein LBD10_06985 [Desulfobulbus sp.]|uniref:hypothetical protein n=1 Tax=Desulfobulbus sp. TaxID=895 RepID=UPI00283BD2FB|nr:hypothetical protein [Desulfobulbus sp.]MDR2549924.1 hypothetical protein [Desulfobulbus sp.]
MKKFSRQGRTVVIAMGVVAIVLACLPLLFGQVALSRARQEVAGRLHANLEADSCSLGWFGGLRCKQVRYQDAARGVHLEAAKLTSDKGLLLLLMAPSFLGDISVDQPVLTFLPPASDPSATADSSQQTASSSDGDARQPFPSWWEDLSFRIKAAGGRIAIDHGAASPRQIARQFELDGNLAMGSLRYELSFLSPQQSGQLRASGYVNLPLAGQSFPEMLVAYAEVSVAELEIADFLQLAASRSPMPQGQGILNATLYLNVAGTRKFEAKGETSLRNLQLFGGMLGQDQPRIEEIDFRFAGGHRQDEGWRLDALELHSAPVHLSAKGGFRDGTGSLSATGKVNLPLLAAQVPRLLNLHRQTVINEGTVDFSLDATGNGQAVAVRTDCQTESLNLTHDGRPYSWTQPLALSAEAEYRNGNTTVRALKVLTPFFEASGGGALDGFTLRGSGDLDQMSRELNTIFDFGIQARGRLELTVATSKTDHGDIGCEGRLAIQDFTWARGNKAPLPAHDLQLSGQAVIGPSFFRDKSIDSLRIEASAWPGNLFFRAGDLRQNGGQAPNNCLVQGNIDLERLTGAIQSLRNDAPLPALKGMLRFDGAGFCAAEGMTMTLHSLQGAIDRLAVSGPGYGIQEPKVNFALGGTGPALGRRIGLGELTVADNWRDLETQEPPFFQVDGAQRRLAVRRLGWASTETDLTLSGSLEDWRQPAAGYSAACKGETSAVLLGYLAKIAGWLPSDVNLDGKARGTLTVQAKAGRNIATEVTLDMAPFAVMRGKNKLFADPHPIVHLVLDKENRPGGSIKMPSLILRSSPLNIEGAGSIAATSPPRLEMQGRINCNYAALLPLLQPLIGRDIVAGGSRTGDLLLSLPLQWPIPMEQLTFSAQLPLDTLALQGVGFKPLVVPVDCNLGKLRCRLDGLLEGGGRASLEPVWDLAAAQPTLSLPAENQSVVDAPLKPALVRLLGRLHPLFGTMARPQGMVSMRPSAFSFTPTDKEGQWPEFTTAITLSRAKFKPSGALHELLALAGVSKEWLSCKEQEMVCEGKKGRVHCGPVRLLAGGDEISLQGETLADDSLRYRIRMPVNQQLAQKAQLTVEGKAMAEVEIKGERTKQAFDAAAFLAGLPAQLQRGVEAASGQPAGNSSNPMAGPTEEKTLPATAREAGNKH